MRIHRHAKIRGMLTRGLTKYGRRLNRRLLDELFNRFLQFKAEIERGLKRAEKDVPRHARKKWRADQDHERRREENSDLRLMVDFLRSEVEQTLAKLELLSAQNVEFRKSYGRSINQDDEQRLLLDYAFQLDQNRSRRRQDTRALQRWLSDDALNDRYLKRRGEGELYLMFVLERLGTTVASVLKLVGSRRRVTRHRVHGDQLAQLRIDTWQRLSIERYIRQAYAYGGDPRVRTAAMRCLRLAIQHLPRDVAGRVLTVEIESLVQRGSTELTRDVWLQCESLHILSIIDRNLFRVAARRRLMHPQPGDDLFVRRHCIRLFAKQIDRFDEEADLFDQLQLDPSDAVKQLWAKTVWQLPPEIAHPQMRLMAGDSHAPAVRAATLAESLEYRHLVELWCPFLRILATRLRKETDPFCVRVALHVASRWLANYTSLLASASFPISMALRDEVGRIYLKEIAPAIKGIVETHESTPVRRWASAALEQIWAQTNRDSRRLLNHLDGALRSTHPGSRQRLPLHLFRKLDDDTIGRTLAVRTQDDLGMDLSRGPLHARVRRPPAFGFRLWRTWYEFWRPATDKRQAHRHTIGRVSQATLRAPSRVMGELSKTKVPGEPLVISEDGTWRPFLPLLDDFVTALNRSWWWRSTTRLYSSEGVTEIEVTRNPFRRLWACLRLTTRFGRYADLRNWEAGSGDADAYLKQLKRLGFRVDFRPHSVPPIRAASDPSVKQFFPSLALFALPAYSMVLWNWVRDYAFYFGSSFENTLGQLVLFTAIAMLFFLVKHAWSNYRFNRSRRSIPISIGGWGTRGKSGTERLKAAVVSATGHGIVSKTTGCEAMFIHGHACGDPLEVPLYRPGDKATIWEQANLINLSKELGPSVFLWECMALTPSYVDVLQRQWMQDDLVTITNTYPDHEDLQGPTGFDVATTISVFVPRKSRVLTTEREMLPLLRSKCYAGESELRPVGWLESGLITQDLLQRFPYEEHPDNIALVAAMSEELGYDYDFSIKSMADYMIPDLGVLKTHPPAPIESVQIEFTNGMSANERFGCMGNWKRLNFDSQDPEQEPNVWVSTVVNNRADRVARSRVFASIIVNDLSADRHFLIGSNLKGLQGFVWEEWSRYVATVTLCGDDNIDSIVISDSLDQLADRMRIPKRKAQIVAEFAAIFSRLVQNTETSAEELAQDLVNAPDRFEPLLDELSLGDKHASKIKKHLVLRLKQQGQYEELQERAAKVSTPPALQSFRTETHTILREWFRAKLVVIENYDATGDEVIQRIVDETPPSFRNRVIGLQNIKGTGLDFVYRFHAWDVCHQGCELLSRPEQNLRQQGANLLESLPEFGVLCRETIREALDKAANAQPAMPANIAVQLDRVREIAQSSDLDSQSEGETSDETESKRTWLADNGLVRYLLDQAEQLMEVHDSLRRRDRADQIYKDLAAGQIGRNTAIQELRKLNKRQKGGWLASKILRR